MNRRSIASACFVVLSVVGLGAQTAADPWMRRSSKPKDFAAARLPWNTFTIELPKSWQLSPGYGGILVNAVEKTKANTTGGSIVLEQMRLPVPLTANEIDADLAELEANATKMRDPGGQNFEQQVKEFEGKRLVFVTYTRPGINGGDSVVQYVIPSGSVMYRLVCIAPTAELTRKYQAVFAHVAASFKPTPGDS